MSLDKVLIDVTLIALCVFLGCFSILLLMMTLDGWTHWRRERKQRKSIKPTVPKSRGN